MKTLSVTIPDELYKKLEQNRKKGFYNRSEFVREALRRFVNVPSITATKEENQIFIRGSEEFSRGEFVSLDKLDKLV